MVRGAAPERLRHADGSALEVGNLDGVGHGTTLGERYRLEDRLESGRESAFWRALDETLDRPVGVRVVVGPTAEETLDAARRAAMVEDSRLLRVLDVGTEDLGGPVTYVVFEFVETRSLGSVLREDGPLPAEQVRSLVGEAAQGLEHARRAGLHHQRLTPDSLLVGADGKVKVTGLAVDAAAAGAQDDSDVTAARQDAVALVGCLYAGLTGRWPLTDPPRPAGLELAPQVAGQPSPPADLVGGVPNDLDTLCAVTFGPHDDGPRTPGELADQLAPWGRARADSDGATTAFGATSGPGAALRPAGRFPVRIGQPAAAGADAAVAAGAGVAAAGAGVVAAGAPAGQAAEPPATRAMPAYDPPVSSWQLGGQGSDREGSGEHPTAGYGGHQPGGQHSAGQNPGDGPDDDRLSFAQAIGTHEYAAEPRGASNVQKLILGVVALLVVVGLVLAVNSLAGIGGGDDQQAAPPATTATPTEPATSEPPPSTQPPSETASGPAPAVAGIVSLDPQGGDGENDDQLARAIDDDPGTYWPSSTYKTADFGGLKDGVGVVVQLAEKSKVTKVTLGFNGSGGQFELRSAPDVGLGGSAVIGTGSVTGSTVEVEIAEPVETQHVIIWFTELPTTDAGFRIELTQVQVA